MASSHLGKPTAPRSPLFYFFLLGALASFSLIWQYSLPRRIERDLRPSFVKAPQQVLLQAPTPFEIIKKKNIPLRVAFVQTANSTKNVLGTFRNLDFLRIATADLVQETDRESLIYSNEVENAKDYDFLVLRAKDARLKRILIAKPDLIIGVMKPYDNEEEIKAAISFAKKRTPGYEGPPRIFGLCENELLEQFFSSRGIPAIMIRMVEDVPPNVSPLSDFPPISKNRPAVVCYLGYHGHLFGEMYWWRNGLLPALSKWPIRLKIMTAAVDIARPMFEDKAGLKSLGSRSANLHVDWWAFDHTKVYEELSTCDIGIVPQWTAMVAEHGQLNETDVVTYGIKPQCHVGRALMFMQVGVPVIVESCPDVDRVFADNILTGRARGLTIDHPKAWGIRLEALLSSPSVRRDISRNALAYATVEASPKTQALRLLDFVARMYYRDSLREGDDKAP